MNADHTAPSPITSETLTEAASIVTETMQPFAGADWSVRAGSLEWDVERTVVHFLGALSKYCLYLGAQGDRNISLRMAASEGATQQELIDSIVPTATALAYIARWAPSGSRGFHSWGPRDATGFLALGCVELLVHANDALLGLGSQLQPPTPLSATVLAAEYPEVDAGHDPWRSLLLATGRQA